MKTPQVKPSWNTGIYIGYRNGKIDASKFSNLDDAIQGFEIDRPDSDFQKGYLLALLHLKRGV